MSDTYTVIARAIREAPLAYDSAALESHDDWKIIAGVVRARGELCLFRIEDHHADGTPALWMSRALLRLLGIRGATNRFVMHVHEKEMPAGISLYQIDEAVMAELRQAQDVSQRTLSPSTVWARRRNSTLLTCITAIMSTKLDPAVE